jgi:hypothetical protein
MEAEETVLAILDEGIQDTKWIETNRAKLRKAYDEQFIAVKNQNVIASGKNYDELCEALSARKVSPHDVMIEFITKIVRIL